MDPKEPTFAERTASLKEAALQLGTIAELALAEAQRMEAAQARFAAQQRRRPRA